MFDASVFDDKQGEDPNSCEEAYDCDLAGPSSDPGNAKKIERAKYCGGISEQCRVRTAEAKIFERLRKIALRWRTGNFKEKTNRVVWP